MRVWILMGSLAAAILLFFSGCSDGGSKPVGFGAITGTVRQPYSTTATASPVAGARVRVAGGDFDTTTTADSTGTYLIDDVPARVMTVSATAGDCMSGSTANVTVKKADTITVDVILDSRADFEAIPLPGSGAVRMEIAPGGGQAVLLYDSLGAAPGRPSVIRIDLNTGAASSLGFTDIIQAYDIRFVNDGEFVFNFRDAIGYGVRFVNLATMVATGDLRYSSVPSGRAGRLAVGPSGQVLFVTHQIFQVFPDRFVKEGKLFAINIPSRKLIDADNDTTDGLVAFDTSLALGSMAYPYNIAYDPSEDEILVGNHDGDFLTAIKWSEWGHFVRQSKPASQGVRKIPMTSLPAEQVWFFGFASGVGIVAQPNGATARYLSGAAAGDVFHAATQVTMSSDSHFMTVVPSRQSWFTLFQDLTESDPLKQQTAVEERSSSTLRRLYRYESKHFVLPDRGFPRAFAVDAANKRLYVAYLNRPIMEVFCLP